jgi:hypothetical protein
MADRYEGKRGTVARTYEIALPRELSPQGRAALAADMRAAFFERYPSVWAIHNPIDREGAEHPHMHLMLNERRPMDGIERGPKCYFSRTAVGEQEPATHGVRKDRSWQGPARLRELREGIAVLTNAALEREGHAVAVSHQSLRAQGHTREAAIYTNAKDKPQVEALRDGLHRDYHPWENDLNTVAWHEQKQREGIRDISREAMVDHVRDRFWQHDQSPAREQERQESLLRAIDREYERTGRERQGEHTQARDVGRPGQDHGPQQERPGRHQEPTSHHALPFDPSLLGLDDDVPAGSGVRVRLFARERDEGRGR